MTQPRILYRHGQPISAEVLSLLATRTASGGVQNMLWAGAGTSRPSPTGPTTVYLVSTSTDDSASIPATPAVPESDAVTLSGTPVLAAAATVDEYGVAIAGDAPVAGDVFTVTVDATDYASEPYIDGQTIASIYADLMAKIAVDTFYVPSAGDPMLLAAVSPGVFAHMVTVSTTSATATITATHNVAGAAAIAASVASITDGTHTYAATYAGGGLTALAAALAAAVDGHDGYSATAALHVATITGPDGFTFTDLSAHGVTAAFVPTAGSALVPGTDFSGARTVLLTYLNGAGLTAQEVIPLNGVTPVSSVATDITAVQSLALVSVGSGGGAAGDITCQDLTTDAVYEVVKTGGNCSLSVAITVPARRSLLIDRAVFSPGSATLGRVRVTADSRPGDSAPGFSSTVIDQYVSQVVVLDQLEAPLGPFPAGTKLQATVEGDGAIVAVDLLVHFE